MPATINVLYTQGTKFNLDYYLSTHMPLVQGKWTQYGLKSWKVLKYPDDAPYSIQATLEFGSLDEFHKAAAGPEHSDIVGDIKNFADKDPLFLTGDVIATS